MFVFKRDSHKKDFAAQINWIIQKLTMNKKKICVAMIMVQKCKKSQVFITFLKSNLRKKISRKIYTSKIWLTVP